MSDGSCVWQAKIKPTAVGEKRTSLDRRVAEEAETQGTACTCTGNGAGGIASKRAGGTWAESTQASDRNSSGERSHRRPSEWPMTRPPPPGGEDRARHIHARSRRERFRLPKRPPADDVNRTGAAARANCAQCSCLRRRPTHDVENSKEVCPTADRSMPARQCASASVLKATTVGVIFLPFLGDMALKTQQTLGR